MPGLSRGPQPLDAAVSAAAEQATATADLVLFVVDATVGITEEDAAAAAWLRGAGTPVLLVANKVDSAEQEAQVAELYGLGLGDPAAVSALHGRGSGDLLDLAVDRLLDAGAFDAAAEDDGTGDAACAVALIGRQNVGKSSLFNRLAGEERAIVDDRPGTTRDAVDTVVELPGGRVYRFVDTAGLRRKARHADATEYYSTVRTVQALDRAAVALLVLDAAEPLGEQDQRLARQVLDAGRAIVLVLNKWDLVDDYGREQLDRQLDRLLGFVSFASVVRTSALTGRGVNRLLPAIDAAHAHWRQRIPTAQLNSWLADTVAATEPPLHAGRPVRLRYVTQVAVGPPTFRVFATGEVPPAYLRYLERRLRERFGFEGTPVDIALRVRPRWEERTGTQPTSSGRRRGGGGRRQRRR
jgi:GTP-binding protein